jgi:hypothetical protein
MIKFSELREYQYNNKNELFKIRTFKYLTNFGMFCE